MTLGVFKRIAKQQPMFDQKAASRRILDSVKITNWLQSVGDVTLSVPWSAESLVLFGYREIESAQLGYSDMQQEQFWGSHVAIGLVVSNPIITSIEVADKSVLFARHGMGKWQPKPLAPSLETFGRCIDTWCELVGQYEHRMLDDEYELNSELRIEFDKRFGEILQPEHLSTWQMALG